MDWYYVDLSRQQHATDADTLRTLVADGVVTPSTLVWNETLPDWVPCSEALPGLFTAADLASPPPLGPGQLRQAGGAGVLLSSPNAPSTELDPWAVASLVLGVVGLFCCQFLGIPAVICGHIGLKAANEGRCSSSSKGLAIAGLITGYITLLIAAAFFVFYLVTILGTVGAAAVAVP